MILAVNHLGLAAYIKMCGGQLLSVSGNVVTINMDGGGTVKVNSLNPPGVSVRVKLEGTTIIGTVPALLYPTR